MTEQESTIDAVRPSRSRLVWLTVGTVVVLLIGVWGMRSLSRRRKPPRKVQPPAIALHVNTMLAKKQDRVLYIEGFATAQATQQVQIVSELAGIVRKVLPDLKPGRTVKKGEFLFAIDSRSYVLEHRRLRTNLTSLERQIKLARIGLVLDQRGLQRNLKLLKTNSIDPATIDRDRLRVRERQQRLETLVQSFELTKVQIQTALLQLERTRVKAPFNARVISGGIDPGNYVVQGKVVATLESITAVDLPVAVTMSSLYQLLPKGKPQRRGIIDRLKQLPHAEVRVGDAPDAVWKGRVIRVGGEVDRRTRTIDMWVRVSLPQQQGGMLLSGSYCQVRIPYRKVLGVYTFPRVALHGKSIYVVEQNQLKIRKVEVLHIGADEVIVRAGVEPGDRVILTELLRPIEGMPVLYKNNQK